MILNQEQISLALADRKLSVVARAVGVNERTLRLLCEKKHAPRYTTLVALSDYLSTHAWDRQNA